jgi:hypothetical protein
MKISSTGTYASNVSLATVCPGSIQVIQIFGSAEPDPKQIIKGTVPSGQIGSASEWYHWKGLEKDINRYRFLILILIFEKT